MGADSNWGTTFRIGLENWGEGLALCPTVVETSFQNGQAKKTRQIEKKQKERKKHSFSFNSRSLLGLFKKK